MDKELPPWLETYTFPEEAKFSDLDYAKTVYSAFVNELWRYGQPIFIPIHPKTHCKGRSRPIRFCRQG